MRGSTARGFTLIELLVALAILAIIASVAVPLYTGYSQRAYRSELQSDLLACAQSLERFAAVNFTYQNSADTDSDGLGDADSGPIAAEVCNPLSVAQVRYNVTVVATAAGFTLTGDPVTGPMEDDGFLTINEAGVRLWDKNDDGDTLDAGEDNWEED